VSSDIIPTTQTGFITAFRKAGFDNALIERLGQVIEGASLEGQSPSDRVRSIQREEQRFVGYANWLARIRKIAAPNGVLFYPAAGLDMVSVVAIGTRRAVLLDREYFSELTEAVLRAHLERCFDSVEWRQISADVATAEVEGPQGMLALTFVSAELEDAEALVTVTVGSDPMVYLAKACGQTSVIFPPAWIDRFACLGYAIDAARPALAAALPRLYVDVIYAETQPDRELMLAWTYLSGARPRRDLS
jgi:hypothetical protein